MPADDTRQYEAAIPYRRTECILREDRPLAVQRLKCCRFRHASNTHTRPRPLAPHRPEVSYVGGDLIGLFGGHDSNVAFVVHLAGAVYAYMFFRTQWELSEIFNRFPSVGGFANVLKSKPTLRVHNPGAQSRDDLADKADQVLEKLHQHGEASLSPRERKILEDYSRSIKQKNR